MSAETDSLNELLSIEPETIDVESIDDNTYLSTLSMVVNGDRYIFIRPGTGIADAVATREVLDAIQLLRRRGFCSVIVNETPRL